MAEKVYFTPKKKGAPAADVSLSREALHEQLCRMPPSQFNWVIFYLRIPKISIPPPIEPQTIRAEAILRFVEKPGGIGLSGLSNAIQKSFSKAGEQGAALDLGGAGAGGGKRWVGLIAGVLLLGVLGFGLKGLLSGEEPRCGDGILQAGEACDDGNQNDADGCKADCTLPVVADAQKAEQPGGSPPATNVAPTTTSTEPGKDTIASNDPAPSPDEEIEPPAPEDGPVSLSPDLAIYFQKGEDVFYPESFSVLDEVVQILEKNKKLRIRIEGHTDSDGSTAKNFNLSKQRADVVKSYLLTRGIAASRLETIGCGVVVPVASNATEEGRRKNRRVEFIDLAKNPKSCQPREK